MFAYCFPPSTTLTPTNKIIAEYNYAVQKFLVESFPQREDNF